MMPAIFENFVFRVFATNRYKMDDSVEYSRSETEESSSESELEPMTRRVRKNVNKLIDTDSDSDSNDDGVPSHPDTSISEDDSASDDSANEVLSHSDTSISEDRVQNHAVQKLDTDSESDDSAKKVQSPSGTIAADLTSYRDITSSTLFEESYASANGSSTHSVSDKFFTTYNATNSPLWPK